MLVVRWLMVLSFLIINSGIPTTHTINITVVDGILYFGVYALYNKRNILPLNEWNPVYTKPS